MEENQINNEQTVNDDFIESIEKQQNKSDISKSIYKGLLYFIATIALYSPVPVFIALMGDVVSSKNFSAPISFLLVGIMIAACVFWLVVAIILLEKFGKFVDSKFKNK